MSCSAPRSRVKHSTTEAINCRSRRLADLANKLEAGESRKCFLSYLVIKISISYSSKEYH